MVKNVAQEAGSRWNVALPPATPFFYQSAASVNAISVKRAPGLVFNIIAINTTATLYYLKFYDMNGVPVAGSGEPRFCLPVPASTFGNGLVVQTLGGIQFNNGIAFTIVANLANSDATVAAAGVAVNLTFT